MITDGPAESSILDDVKTGKKTKADVSSQASSTTLLLHLNSPYISLQEATQCSNVTLTPVIVPFIEQLSDEWKNVQVGATKMLYNEALNKYRCPSIGCTFESGKAAGVAVHHARFCKYNDKVQPDLGDQHRFGRNDALKTNAIE